MLCSDSAVGESGEQAPPGEIFFSGLWTLAETRYDVVKLKY